ncbi:TetR/AcrR family transcriptional regulator [Streptomyces echinatus]|uniref:TetR/AcrR family transcriptional regulator n=1 Tax=Streptomyces echinatus TaxID=67293 RepID=UPI00378A8D4D
MFAESGFAGVSIRQIAGILGINAATLYARYPSKGHAAGAVPPDTRRRPGTGLASGRVRH